MSDESRVSLQIFNFNGANVRTVLVGGEPLWPVKDLCDVLGLSDTNKAVAGLDDDETNTIRVADSLGREQEMLAVNEPGLYSLVLKSRKPIARSFKRWITHEVIPSVRKTGSYSVSSAVSEVDKLAVLLQAALPQITGQVAAVEAKVIEQADRIAAVEERQRVTDPREVEARMVKLTKLAKGIVKGTKESEKPVTFPSFWHALHEVCRVASFKNRAALDVPMLERAITHATDWAFSRGVNPQQSLFDQPASVEA